MASDQRRGTDMVSSREDTGWRRVASGRPLTPPPSGRPGHTSWRMVQTFAVGKKYVLNVVDLPVYELALLHIFNRHRYTQAGAPPKL